MPSNGEDLVIFMLVHVNDSLVAINSLSLYHWILAEMNKCIEVVDQGAVSLYLGIQITRNCSKRKLWLSQYPFIVDLLTSHNLMNAHSSPIPLRHLLHDLLPVPAGSLPDVSDDNVRVHFQHLVGSLLYLTICMCPNISYTAMGLGQFNANPTRLHLLAAKGVLRYLLGTMDFALEYNFEQAPVGNPTSLFFLTNCGFSDADWASDKSSHHSVSGFTFFLYGSLISWSALLQCTVALSSTEAEYMALAYALKDGTWIRLFLIILGLPNPSPFPILCDNQSTLNIANSEATHSRSKHIDVRHHFIKDLIASGAFATSWVSTLDMVTDIFTKPLPPVLHKKHCTSLGLVRLP